MALVALFGIAAGIGIGIRAWLLFGVGLAGIAGLVLADLFLTHRDEARRTRDEAQRRARREREIDDLVAAGNTVSVIVPAFNASGTVGTALASLQSQSYPDWQCIVVDDASTDDTVEVVRRAAADDQRIVLLALHRNSGAAAARNAGLAAATGDHIVYLDADDLLLSDALFFRVRALGRHPDASGALGRQSQVTSVEGWQGMSTERVPKTPSNVNISTAAGDQPFGCPGAVLMRHNAARDLAGFDEGMLSSMDFDYWMRSLRSGHEFVYSGHLDTLYRQVAGSIVGSNVERHGRRFKVILDAEWEGSPRGFRLAHDGLREGPLGAVLRDGIAQLRYLRVAGMMVGIGRDPAEVVASIADLAPTRAPLPLVYATQQLAYGIRRELRRSASVDDARLATVARDRALEVARMFVPVVPGTLVAPDQHSSWAIVVTDEPDAKAAVEAIRDIAEDHMPTFVTTDAWLGDFGGADVLAGIDRPVSTVSLPGFFLQGVAYRTVFVPKGHDWIWSLVSSLAATRGSQAVLADYVGDVGRIRAAAYPRGAMNRVGVYGTLARPEFAAPAGAGRHAE